MKVLELMQLLLEIDANLPGTINTKFLGKKFKLFLIFLGPACTFLSIIAFCIANAADFEVVIVTMYNIIGVLLCISLNVSFCCQSRNMKNFIAKIDHLVNKSECIYSSK